jgi:hypothetical protein
MPPAGGAVIARTRLDRGQAPIWLPSMTSLAGGASTENGAA